MSRRRRMLAASLLALLLCTTVRSAAQVKAANISGYVQDQLERRILGATVSATNTRTSVRYQAKTDRSGAFDFIGVPAGDYILDARFAGFTPLMDVVTMGGADVQRTITLEIAPIQVTLAVSADTGTRPPDLAREAPKRPSDQEIERCSQPAAGGCLQPAVLIRQVSPNYGGVDGKVVLQGEIGTDGAVRELEIVLSTDPRLEQTVNDAVVQWRFTPARLDGVPIDAPVQIILSFESARR